MTDDDIDLAIWQTYAREGYGMQSKHDQERDRAIYRAGFAAGIVAQAQIRIPTDTMEQEFAKYERRGYAAGIEAAAKVCEGGRFLHDDAPDAKWARSCVTAIRALNTTKEK